MHIPLCDTNRHTSVTTLSFKDQIKPCTNLLFYLPSLLIPSESTYRHQATIDDEVVTMEILDTAGQVNKGFS